MEYLQGWRGDSYKRRLVSAETRILITTRGDSYTVNTLVYVSNISNISNVYNNVFNNVSNVSNV